MFRWFFYVAMSIWFQKIQDLRHLKMENNVKSIFCSHLKEFHIIWLYEFLYWINIEHLKFFLWLFFPNSWENFLNKKWFYNFSFYWNYCFYFHCICNSLTLVFLIGYWLTNGKTLNFSKKKIIFLWIKSWLS